MRIGIYVIAVAACVLGKADTLVAQINWPGTQPTSSTSQLTVATTVTFNIPVNLTQLSPDLEKVMAVCVVTSEALAQPPVNTTNVTALPNDQIPVVNGQVIATMRVLVPIYAEFLKADAKDKEAQYQCALMGFSRSAQGWGQFSESSPAAALLLKPAPLPITGTFRW